MNKTQQAKIIIITLLLWVIIWLCFRGWNKPQETQEEAPINSNVAVCPEMAYVYFWENCISHLDEWYPGKLTEDWKSQLMPELKQKTSHERFKELAEKYWFDASIFWKIEEKYKIREGVILGIIIAETSWWKNGNYVNEWCFNYGNVGNNDRWDRSCYNTPEESIEAIGRTLSNRYLGSTQTLGCLSKAWSCKWWEDKWYVYASSDWNWERTMVNVLNAIYWEELWNIEPDRFNVRRTFTIYQ